MPTAGPPTESPQPRILVAEDEALIAIQIEEDLCSAGWHVIGPFATLASALQAARREEFDLAILDVNLNGKAVYPLVGELLNRGLPVVLLSGYQQQSLPEPLRGLPRLGKPYDPAALVDGVRNLLGV